MGSIQALSRQFLLFVVFCFICVRSKLCARAHIMYVHVSWYFYMSCFRSNE